MNAAAWQATGLDADCQFAFHTRPPSFSVTPPDIRPLIVALRAKLAASQKASAPMLAESELGGWSIAGELRLDSSFNSAEPPVPETVSTLASVSVRGRGAVRGDRSPAKIALGEFGFKSVPVLVAIPEQSREAWIVASIDVLPESMLPGAAELVVDGAATGRTNISESMAGMMQMPFGMVSRLTSKKAPLVSKRGSNWIGSGTLDDGYTLEITSGLGKEQEVMVRDRIPIPADDKITVEVKRIDPAPDERDPENRLSWKIKIKPGETKRITVEYNLKFPRNESLEFR
jgi:hypothetical protein